MASELVERLAKRAADEEYPMVHGGYDAHPHAYENHARWFIRALADYFETQEAIDAWPYPGLHPANVADFLRDQVGAPSDD